MPTAHKLILVGATFLTGLGLGQASADPQPDGKRPGLEAHVADLRGNGQPKTLVITGCPAEDDCTIDYTRNAKWVLSQDFNH